ncbi:hypothetical protein J437_LFUL003543 [Ladona fulva]|uniref:C3H1-type domain-containing protein n=1 Tax=Ladona fulva TaxID=123851 RepID=A0A8K0JZ14_LADFU|nr:hypothetical protein J437_LFUL003543 [Ladona fulva]
MVISSVFNIDVCSAVLKNADSGEIKNLNMNSKAFKNSFAESESFMADQNVQKNEEVQGEQSNSVMPNPPSSDTLDPEGEVDDWNPMEDDYQESEITYQGMVNDDASAIIGYQAKDEARICKFYASTGHCYKGSSCRKEHSFIRPDVPNDKCPEENLENLIDLINSKVNVANFKRLVMPPGIGEIVLCKMFPSNLYHRAQVIDTNLEENQFLVLFVDVGSTDWVHVRNMRQIENRYLHLPFQAIECQLAYCGTPENIDGSRKMEIMRKLSNMISSKDMKAYVVKSISAINKMVVELFDDKGKNVGKALKEGGYLVESPEMYESKIKHIPG